MGKGKDKDKEREKEQRQSGRQMIRRQFFRLLPFQVLLLVVNAINGIVDSMFASNLIGKEAMTAIGMFGPLNHFLYAVSIMLVSGSQMLYGKYIAKNQKKEMQNLFSVNLAVSMLGSVVLGALLFLAGTFGFSFMGGLSAAEQAAFNHYLIGTAFGIPGLVLGQQLFAFLSMENQTRRTMIASLTCVVFNIGLDYLLLQIARMGVFGLALGSSLSYWAFFASMAIYYVSGKSELRFSLHGLQWKETLQIVRLGYAGSISRFMEMFRCVIVNGLILTFVGSVGLSSFAASNSVMAIFWAVPFGIMAVNRMLLSISVGEEDRPGTVDIMREVLRLGLLLIAVVVVALIFLAEPLTRLFFRDPSDPVYSMTVMGLRMLPLCMPLAIVSLNFCGYAQIMQKKLAAVLLPVVDGMIGVVGFSIVLIPIMKMNGLYLANILNGFVCLLVIIGLAAIEKKRFPRTLEELMAMPDSFGVGKENYLEFSIRSVEEVTEVSERVQEFCLSKGIDRRRAMMAGLAMEEMAGNVVKYGFETDPTKKNKKSADFRITCKGDEVILRLRDNCAPFDPSVWTKIHEPEDPVSNAGIRILAGTAKEMEYHMGIRLAYGVAQDVQYNNILGRNVLVIRM